MMRCFDCGEVVEPGEHWLVVPPFPWQDRKVLEVTCAPCAEAVLREPVLRDLYACLTAAQNAKVSTLPGRTVAETTEYEDLFRDLENEGDA